MQTENEQLATKKKLAENYENRQYADIAVNDEDPKVRLFAFLILCNHVGYKEAFNMFHTVKEKNKLFDKSKNTVCVIMK